ncbi:E3 ubiquitin-protein ligase MARCH2-like [Sipha flava]|uniref:E3 ubiquitin-protein ligase MARCH2-like n=1 Tax=Sipha flava TaxID=143950 RepID=A0A8B8F5H4_9HEMI|nr:E3 ubiquitin-protein ligase MARCH2-like [Sipha flava]
MLIRSSKHIKLLNTQKKKFWNLMETQESKSKSTCNCEEPQQTPLITDICRICLESGSNELNKFITHCHCRGSIGKVHKECLEKWLVRSDTNGCEICNFQYKTKRNNKYSLLGSVKEWYCNRENQHEIGEMVNDGWLLLKTAPFILLLSFAGMYIANHIFIAKIQIFNDLIDRIISLGVCTTIIFVDLLISLVISYRIHYHIQNWLDFYHNNQEVIIIDPNLPEDTL